MRLWLIRALFKENRPGGFFARWFNLIVICLQDKYFLIYNCHSLLMMIVSDIRFFIVNWPDILMYFKTACPRLLFETGKWGKYA